MMGPSDPARCVGSCRAGRVILIAGPDATACSQAALTGLNGGLGQGPSIGGALMSELVEMANNERYTVNVEKTFPLAQANDAYGYGRSANRESKVVIVVDDKASQL